MESRMAVNGLDLYAKIMEQEEAIHKGWKFDFFARHRAHQIFGDVVQLTEIAKASTIPRSYLKNYNLDSSDIVFESVSAHTNLCRAILSRALDDLRFYLDISNVENGFSNAQIRDELNHYSDSEIFEAMNIHDLPENDIGDMPDNGTIDQAAKTAGETKYFDHYISLYSRKKPEFGQHVVELVHAMEDPNSIIGQILHLSDKVAAIITTLTYDRLGHPPVMSMTSTAASDKDRKEMAVCDYYNQGFCKASEMWTMDYFLIRRFVDRDHTGYFTSLIVAATLMANDNKWYDWRTQGYLEPEKITPTTTEVPII